MGSQSLSGYRRDSRIKPETMLSRVSAFADVSEEITLEQLFEYAWPEELPPDTKNGPTYYVIQELLADFLRVCLLLKCLFFLIDYSDAFFFHPRLNHSNVAIQNFSGVSAMLTSEHGFKKLVLYLLVAQNLDLLLF